MATYINGQGGTVTVASTTLPAETWNIALNCEALDTTTTASAGWEENIAGIKSAEGSVKSFWDTTTVETGFVTVGTALSLTLPVGSSAKSFTLSARVTQISVENPAKGAIPFSFNFKSTGAVTYPT